MIGRIGSTQRQKPEPPVAVTEQGGQSSAFGQKGPQRGYSPALRGLPRGRFTPEAGPAAFSRDLASLASFAFSRLSIRFCFFSIYCDWSG